MANKRFAVHFGERGRVVLPAEARRSLGLSRGDMVAVELDEGAQTLTLRTTGDVARSAHGLLRNLAPGADLTAELLADRREDASRENAGDPLPAGR